MVDKFSKETRSRIISKIRDRDTKLEILVRSYLFSRGFRFRKNDKRYLGSPDVVLPKYKTMVFVHGCFWNLLRVANMLQCQNPMSITVRRNFMGTGNVTSAIKRSLKLWEGISSRFGNVN